MNIFTLAYLTAALWSSTGDKGEPLDRDYSPSDIAPATLTRMEADCTRFLAENAENIRLADIGESHAGHCLWLSRNGHGSGFWDEYPPTTCDAYEREQTCPCPFHVCQRLSAAAKAFGTFDLYIGDDGQIHGA